MINYAAHQEIGFLPKSISKPFGHSTVMPPVWELRLKSEPLSWCATFSPIPLFHTSKRRADEPQSQNFLHVFLQHSLRIIHFLGFQNLKADVDILNFLLKIFVCVYTRFFSVVSQLRASRCVKWFERARAALIKRTLITGPHNIALHSRIRLFIALKNDKLLLLILYLKNSKRSIIRKKVIAKLR